MIWFIGILSFAVGLCLGAVIFKQFMSDAAKVEQLENELSSLKSEFEHYKNSVHSHFSSTAQVVNKFTDSYREVYRHLAAGAQSLCPESISSQLSLSAQKGELLGEQFTNESLDSFPDSSPNNSSNSLFNNQYQALKDDESLFPPRDYADKANSSQQGGLSESYGLEKETSEETEDPTKPLSPI